MVSNTYPLNHAPHPLPNCGNTDYSISSQVLTIINLIFHLILVLGGRVRGRSASHPARVRRVRVDWTAEQRRAERVRPPGWFRQRRVERSAGDLHFGKPGGSAWGRVEFRNWHW